MLIVACLLNINFALLRSARNAIAVADLSGSAALVPFYELFGTLPSAVLMTWLMALLLNRYSLDTVFTVMGGLFISFFLLFAFLIYPQLVEATKTLQILCSGLFYVMAELWKVVLLTVLFWALVNRYTSLQSAKALYGPLMLAGSVGSLLAGPLASFCTSHVLWLSAPLGVNRWSHALVYISVIVSIVGLAAILCYRRLSYGLKGQVGEEPMRALSLSHGIAQSLKIPQLRLLGWIVIADYIAYSLAEVVFLNVLKQRFPDPADYCQFMGMLSTWSGVLTAISALWIAPMLLKRHPWLWSAAVTPVLVIVCEILFFSVYCCKEGCLGLLGWELQSWLAVCVLLGSVQYTLCRAAKYTLLDSSKEIVFVGLPAMIALEGKLVIDGIGARAGRGISSGVTLGLVHLFGGVALSTPAASLIAMLIAGSWLLATVQLAAEKEESPIGMEKNRKIT